MKILDTEAQQNFLVSEQMCARDVSSPDSSSRGHGSSVFKTLPDLTLFVFIWLFLSCILYNKTVKYSTSMNYVSHSSELLSLRG